MERKTTSIKVDPELWKEFKKHAIDLDTDISDLVEQLIKKETRK
jgi:hypothetical protein